MGLMRTPPPGGHFKKPSVSETRSIYGSPGSSKAKEPLPESPLPAAEPAQPSMKSESVEEETKTPSPVAPEPETSELPQTTSEKDPEPETAPEPTRKEPPSALKPKPNFSLPSREPLSPKPKPQSPAFDFRANLRKREVVKDAGPEQEPEFKNVFGKLKKTETRNYKAPDELKDNILRSKAALNATGGPKKTERVDEFKESLLKQKDAMKAGGGSLRRNTVEEKDASATAVPEAIAKRNLMTKTNSIQRDKSEEQSSPVTMDVDTTPSPEQTPVSPPEDVAKGEAIEQEALNSPSPVASEPKATEIDLPPTPSEKEDRQDVVEATEPEVEMERKPSNESASSVRGLPSARRAQVANATAAPPSMAAKGTLAGRINPALAGLLSRGPPASAEGPKMEPAPSPSTSDIPSLPSAPLTHMTKGRARGPKRRLPKGVSAAPVVSSAQDTEVGAISSVDARGSQEASETVAPSKPRSASPSINSLVMDAENAQTESPVTEQLPAVSTNFQDAPSSGLQQRLESISPSSPSDTGSLATNEKENMTREVGSPSAARRSSRPPVPPKPSASPSPLSSPLSSPSTPAKPQWVHQGRYTSASPSPLRTNYRENTPGSPTQRDIPGVTIAISSPRNKSLPSPPVPPKRADVSLDKPSDHRLSRKMSAPSLVAQAAEAREVIAAFFKTFPNPRDRMDIDPQLILTSQPDAAKIRTAKRQIWELTGDGRRQELPINQEYVLYEGSMYLCIHLFEGPSGNSSEVYLWCGDDVPEAALDDANLFARKVAREHGCKLEVIRQGKEPVRFIQALGGIIITRRGSSSRHTSSALYMLCGRKHLGQMAFDEVDYSVRNLCSGFPFVVSAPFGKLYLWKGRGSGPEETGAARLISMDLGLTGEFEEVDEGQEPESFFDVFPGSHETNPLMTSDYWQLKPKYDHYRTRLLRVDHQLGQPPRFWGMRRPGSGSPVVRPNDCVQEIQPFCHKDLTEKDVYVLDTFFEIWV